MKRICVFCGSSPGGRPEYRAAAEEMGWELVRRNINAARREIDVIKEESMISSFATGTTNRGGAG